MSDVVTANGLVIPTIEELLSDIEDDLRATIDANLDTDPDSPMGQIDGIMAERFRLLWELVSVAYNAMNPDACEDFLLDATSAITGTIRGEATASTVVLSLNLDATTTVAAGALVSVDGEPTKVFRLTEDVTSTTAGNYPGDAVCTALGRVVANAGTLTVIQSPTTGWNAVTNARDATLGQERDTDPELRIRRVNELEASGAGTVDTIRARVLQITNDDGSKPVLDAVTEENTSDYINTFGIPAHSVETVIWDGQSQDAPNNSVAQAVWDTKGAGISAFGNTTGTATDKLGNPKTIAFSRSGIINGKMAITVETDIGRPDDYSGDPAVKEAIVEEFNTRARLGVTEIRPTHYIKAVLAPGLGILDVTNLQFGNVLIGPFPPNLQNFAVPFRTKVLLDTSNITITRVPVAP